MLLEISEKRRMDRERYPMESGFRSIPGGGDNSSKRKGGGPGRGPPVGGDGFSPVRKGLSVIVGRR